MVVLLFSVTLVGAPFTSARAAMFPDVLDGDRYVMGTAVTLMTNQFAQVIGFAVGGTIAGFLGTGISLVIDAATFVASAFIVRLWVQNRPAPGTGLGVTGAGSKLGGLAEGAHLVFGNPALRIPMLFGLLTAFYDAPEGVVTPLARSVGGGPVAVGMILAAGALGVTVGSILFSRLVAPDRRLRLMGPLAIVNCGVLVLFALGPGLAVSLLILGTSGFFSAYQLAANAAFVRAAPNEQRSQAFGIAQAGMSLGQGTMMIAAGGAAAAVHPATVIAVCGGLGAAAAAILAFGWSRYRPGRTP
jgi:hypothetical protein